MNLYLVKTAVLDYDEYSHILGFIQEYVHELQLRRQEIENFRNKQDYKGMKNSIDLQVNLLSRHIELNSDIDEIIRQIDEHNERYTISEIPLTNYHDTGQGLQETLNTRWQRNAGILND